MPDRKYKYVTKTFRDETGKRYWVSGKTEEEAIIKRERKKAELAEGNACRRSSTLFRIWAETALKTYKPNVGPRYLAQMRSRLRTHIDPVLGHLPLRLVTPLDCQRVLNTASGMSRSTITKLSQELAFYFEKAVDSGLLQKNPASKLIRPTGYTNRRRSLTDAERAAFVTVAREHPRFLLFELMLYCGCRPAEAASVRYEDVTEVAGIPFLHIRGTKTARSDRLVPIPDELRPRLCAAGSGPCAVTGNGNPINETAYRRLTARLKRELNIALGAELYRNALVTHPLAEDFVPYFFRHTYCTDLKKKGVDLRIARDFMGHADIKTTANIYDHADDDTLLLGAMQMGLCGNPVGNAVVKSRFSA